MGYGLQIINSNGKVFATPDTPFFHLTSKQTIGLRGGTLANKAVDHNTGISSNWRIVCYARCSNLSFVPIQQYQSGGTWWCKIQSSVECTLTLYIFTNDIPASSGGWGMDFFDGGGRRIYSTSTKPLQNLQTNLNHAGPTSVYVGHPAAVIASLCDAFVRPFQQRDVQMMEGVPCAHGDQIDLSVFGSGIMPGSSGFSFAIFGGVVNYINTSLYD